MRKCPFQAQTESGAVPTDEARLNLWSGSITAKVSEFWELFPPFITPTHPKLGFQFFFLFFYLSLIASLFPLRQAWTSNVTLLEIWLLWGWRWLESFESCHQECNPGEQHNKCSDCVCLVEIGGSNTSISPSITEQAKHTQDHVRVQKYQPFKLISLAKLSRFSKKCWYSRPPLWPSISSYSFALPCFLPSSSSGSCIDAQ